METCITSKDMIRGAGLRISTVLTSPLRFRSPTYRRVVEHLAMNNRAARQVRRGDSLGNWRVLHPGPADRFPQADDGAVVLLGQFHGCRILCLSDLGKRGQQLLLQRESYLRADIVISGIPQQGEPLIPELLAAVSPQVMIVGTADYPASAQMNRVLRQRLDSFDAPLISTDVNGAATLVLEPGGWQVRTVSGIDLRGSVRTGTQPAAPHSSGKN
jgi:beta-lactamase superfamily II metal-dependent hydrolase